MTDLEKLRKRTRKNWKRETESEEDIKKIRKISRLPLPGYIVILPVNQNGKK